MINDNHIYPRLPQATRHPASSAEEVNGSKSFISKMFHLRAKYNKPTCNYNQFTWITQVLICDNYDNKIKI